MDDKLSKKFYKIGDVAEILNIPTSTLRFWEKEFTVIKPKRNAKNVRVYTIKDIETVKMIYYLVKEKGLKLDAAQAMIKRNRDGISKQFEVVERLKQVRGQLLLLDNALSAIKKFPASETAISVGARKDVFSTSPEKLSIIRTISRFSAECLRISRIRLFPVSQT